MQPGGRLKIFLCTTFDLCDNNGYLTTQINNFFIQNGHEIMSGPDLAEYIVITTCGFDQDREKRSYAIVSDYIDHYAHEKKIIICGCLVKINPELFNSSQVTIIGPKEIHQFNQIFRPAVKIENVSGGALNERFINKQYGFLDAYYLQICQGCVNNCSYCAIKKAKGYVNSKMPERLMDELETALKAGFKRVMLLGDDCGSYGADLGTNLADLLNKISECDVGININYIQPGRFEKIYPQLSQRTLEHIEFINIPVQSTSKRILGLMNRGYDTDSIFRIVKEIKAKHPRSFFETHIIYGFPSETWEEFQDTFRAADYFDSVIYFYYTDRKGVISSQLEGKIAAAEIVHRTESILNHPQFCIEHDKAEPPVVLLGYDLKAGNEIFKSIADSLLS